VPEPITLGSDESSELVTAGLGAMLGRHSDRIRFVAFDPTAPPVPDIVLCDPHAAPGGAVRVHELVGLGARVVAFSWRVDPASVERALAAGAMGYLPKTLTSEELVAAVEEVHRDGLVTIRPAVLPGEELTARESEVLALVCRGLSNHEIGAELYLSINSIKTYMRQIYRKTAMTRRAQLVAWGLRRGY